VTRGAGFRKEKNKKKRGSYRGGEITVSPIPIFGFSYMIADTGCDSYKATVSSSPTTTRGIRIYLIAY
jgi:hypothetical protein